MTLQKDIFSVIPEHRRIWAVSSPCGDAVRLRFLHKKISAEFKIGDVVVYLGNLLGFGFDVCKAIDEVLFFRRALISIPGVSQSDVVFLRGQQEEMFHRLMQIQFAKNPVEVYDWMLKKGLKQTLLSYGIDPDEGRRILPQGVVAVSRWATALRKAQKEHDGHIDYMAELKHAAYTANNDILFVHFGINHEVSLNLQGDSFWWGGKQPFSRDYPYLGFKQVVRNLSSPKKHGVFKETYYTTLVSGGGFDAPIYAVLFDEKHQQVLIFDA